MLYATSVEEAAPSRKPVPVNGRDYMVSGYVGTAPRRGTYVEGAEHDDDGRPQGFLVEQPPGSVTLPHFHEVDQFQVVVGGNGLIGKHAAAPITVQYVNKHTPYGPIVAGQEGVTYFTLRAGWDPGAKYMPASRHRLVKGNQRTRLAAAPASGDAAALKGRQEADFEVLLAPEADGMAAHLLRLGANGTAPLPDPKQGGGQYLVVVGGGLDFEGKQMRPLSCLFLTAQEQAFHAVAGSAGLELLVLQIPRP